MLTKTIAGFCLIGLLACSQNDPGPKMEGSKFSVEDAKKELRYLKEVEWPKAYAQQDTQLLDRILGEDFWLVGNSGTWDSKADELQWIKANKAENDSFYYEIRRLDVLENGTAVIAGSGHVFNDGKESVYQSSNVLVRREGKWKAILSHVSGYKTLESED